MSKIFAFSVPFGKFSSILHPKFCAGWPILHAQNRDIPTFYKQTALKQMSKFTVTKELSLQIMKSHALILIAMPIMTD